MNADFLPKLMTVMALSATAVLVGCAQAPAQPAQAYVGVSCAALPAMPGAPQLRDSLTRLPGGVSLEILHGNMLPATRLVLPLQANSGDEVSYAWSERVPLASLDSSAPERSGVWRCELAWRYSAGAWQLANLSARWNDGGVP